MRINTYASKSERLSWLLVNALCVAFARVLRERPRARAAAAAGGVGGVGDKNSSPARCMRVCVGDGGDGGEGREDSRREKGGWEAKLGGGKEGGRGD